MEKPEFTIGPVFFDTNALLGAGWPNPSAQLLQALDQLDQINMMYCLSDVVVTELEEHFVRVTREDWNRASTIVQNVMAKVNLFPDFQKLPPLPSREDIKNELRKKTSDLLERFNIIPITARPLSDFVGLATTQGATFKQGGEGFQDCVILLSVIDYLNEHHLPSGIFVSADKIFKTDEVAKIIRNSGVDLKIVGTLDELDKTFKHYLTQLWLDYWNNERAKLKAVLTPRMPDLKQFLIDNLTISPSDLDVFGHVKRIISLDTLSIENTHISLGQDDEALVKASVDLKVRLSLDVERYYSAPPPNLKVGGMATKTVTDSTDSTPNVLYEISEYNLRNPEIRVVVEVEARKSSNGEFTDIRFTRATVRKADDLSAVFDAIRFGATSAI